MNPSRIHFRPRMALAAILAGGLAGLGSAWGQAYHYTQNFESFADEHPIVNEAAWSAGADDLSRVIVSNLVGYTGDYPIPGAHTKVLKLETSGTVLTNTVTAMANGAHSNLYFDALVYLVPSETEPPQDVLEDKSNKVAVYLNSSSNLVMVHGGADGTLTSTVFTATQVVPETWVRLTIPMDMEKVLVPPMDDALPFFQVMIDGTVLSQQDQGFVTPSSDPGDYGTGNGNWFRFANFEDQTATALKISSIAFSGTGMIDDLVLTSDDPISPIEYAEDGVTPLSWVDANFDSDPGALDDGSTPHTLYQGWLMNANPSNAFEIVEIEIANSKPVVQWLSFPGTPNGIIRVDAKTDLTAATWTENLPGSTVHDDGAPGVNNWTGTADVPAGPMFLRVRITE